jgi:uncharacterized protein (TIGR02145 family)
MKTAFKIVGFLLLILSINLSNSCKKDKPTIPLITTAQVTEISTSSAVSGGTITDEGGADIISRGVCWNTLDNPVISNNRTIETGGSVSFTSNIIQLAPNTTYYIRAYATNSAGTGYGNSMTFKTLGDKPASAALNATEITINSATLSGTVNPNSLTTKVTFEYGLSTNYGFSVDATQSPISGDSNGSVSIVLTGLNPGSIYNFRIKAENSLGITYSDNMNFTTLGGLSIATVQAASNINLTNAVLNGSINPNYLSTTGAFEWGLTTSYGNSIDIPQGPFTGNTSIPVNYEITGLSMCTTYHFRLVTVNWWGTTFSSDKSFKTRGQVPAATTLAATSLSTTGAILNGTFYPNYMSTSVRFEYGTSISYGSIMTASVSPIHGDTISNVNAVITGLTENTLYHFRVVASNDLGTGYGDDLTFTTDPSSVSDADGNAYNIVRIGTQLWMEENLRVLHYRNGDPIQNVTENTQWSNLTSGAYCWYLNDEIQYKDPYGTLYNYYTVSDGRDICPAGWRIPSQTDWNTLQSFLGGNLVAGGKLKEAGTVHWYAPNDGATNESNFSSMPGGDRVPTGPFEYIRQTAEFWTSTEETTTTAYVYFLSFEAGGLYNNPFNKKYGLSVRCIK